MANDSKEIWNSIGYITLHSVKTILPKHMPSSYDLAQHFLTKGDDHGPLGVTSIPTVLFNVL